MVFYECVVTAKNTAHFYQLSKLVKNVSYEVVAGGGIVRAVHNHGIRDLPHRFKAKYPDKEGNRYYRKGRFFSIYYDASPSTMRLVEQVLKMDEEVLRNTHLKARSAFDLVNLRPDRNPYVKRVLAQEYKESEAVFHVDESAESEAAFHVDETAESDFKDMPTDEDVYQKVG